MAALAADRVPRYKNGDIISLPVAANAKIYKGALVVMNGGYAAPGSTALGLTPAGLSEELADNTGGAAGAITVRVRRCLAVFDSAGGGDAIAEANAGQACYIVDDHTLALTSGGGTRSSAGQVAWVDSDGVWIALGFGQTVPNALVSTNNLSDVGNAQTARQNLAANKVIQDGFINNLSALGTTFYFVAAVTGTIKAFWSVLQGALATGNATLQLNINGVAVTTGQINQVQAGSAAGQKASTVPTALNAVNAGDVLSVTIGGTNSAAVAATIAIEIDT